MSHTNHSLPYNQQQDDMQPTHYPDFNHHYPFDRLASDSAAEGRTVLYPSQLHPHPLFTRQGNAAGPSIQNRSLELHHNNAVYGSPSPFAQQQSWPPYHHHHQQNYSHHPPPPPYPSPSPFPAPRLSPPPIQHTTQGSFKTPQGNLKSDPSALSRITLAGSLDPSTGIFYRTPEHPRLRTAQACEKCRTRKAKCSGEHPTCKRCLNRGLVCEYAKEGRVRGPNKAKSKSSSNTTGNDSSTSNSTPGKMRHHHHVQHARIGPHSPTVSEEFMYPPPPSFVQQQQQHLYPTMSSGNEFSGDDGSSPHTSVSGGTSTINSPLTPTSASSFVMSPSSASASRMSSMKMDLDMSCVDPTARSSRNGLMEPVWMNHVTQLDRYHHPQEHHHHPIQTTIDERQNEMSTQVMGSSSSVFVENGESQHQNDFHHRQHNGTQHYAAMDLQMC